MIHITNDFILDIIFTVIIYLLASIGLIEIFFNNKT